MRNKLTDSARVIFWILVVVGGLLLANREFILYNQRKEKELDDHLKRVCIVITDQQPNNTDLYDTCMDRGYEEFGSTAEDSGGFDQ
ncbi:MAG: hypothetical protein A2427_00455 [Candidatus Nealsonbacteria bacterium RIFOXYC1_FULL_40_7]|uniref:Uncharacterized protein n=1 Tax=Candidatus Nealsonbacteria bacterium RIFOXYC1_FULL_40_7 TaxID=1801678 RepID=A0A1G2EQE9_9BACT|nr:MAG: hypothetical protein A2427_00455 [Candidatus Nealsonbacteria bacterium RIFOXYC1_FULL_40_7]